jgi:hypothetical protein
LAGGSIGLGRSSLVGNRTFQGSVSWIGHARSICRGLCDSQFHWGRVASKVTECLAGGPTVRSVSLGEVAFKATESCRRPTARSVSLGEVASKATEPCRRPTAKAL